MSQLSKSLEKRIQELTESIEAQKTELAAYERVLHMEVSKDMAPGEASEGEEETASVSSRASKKKAVKKGIKKSAGVNASADGMSGVEYTGNKTNLVAEIVKSYGSEGATPKDVDAHFTARNVKRSKNLIYNTLSYLVAQKKLFRRNGKYFATAGRGPVAKKKAAAPAKKAATKRRLSPEGLKRIKEALKKRWAEKKAAEATPAAK